MNIDVYHALGTLVPGIGHHLKADTPAAVITAVRFRIELDVCAVVICPVLF